MIVKTAQRSLRVFLLMVGVLIIVLALCTIIARIGLPLLASHKSDIEARISDYLNSPVEIGELSLRWKGSGPMLHARDVAVYESDERSVQLDELLVDINLAKSLLQGIPIINELSLVGARLAIESDADGQFGLHGTKSIAANDSGEDDVSSPNRSRGVDIVAWLFNARKVGLLDTELVLSDLKTGRRIVIDDLNILAENNGDNHMLRVDAQLPEALGGFIEVGVDLVGDSNALAQSDGNWHMSAESFSISGLTSALRMSGLLASEAPAPFDIDALGTIEMWGNWQDGQTVSAQGPLTLTAIVEKATGETLLDSASAQYQLTHDGRTTSILVSDVQANHGTDEFQLDEVLINRWLPMELQDSQSFPPGTSDGSEPVLLAANGSDPLWELAVSGAEVPLALTGRLAAIVLYQSQPDLVEQLLKANINGSIRGLVFDVAGLPHSSTIDWQGDISDLTIDNMAGLPAFGPVSGPMSIKNSVGTVQLSAKQMPFSWSVPSDTPLQIDSLAATVDIDLSDLQRLKIGADIQLADNGITADTSVKSTLVPGTRPHLHIQSQFESDDISQIASWLPREILSPKAISWLEQAFVTGKATDGSLLYFGNVADFPFENGEGVFHAELKTDQAELFFLDSWPAARNINADIELNGLALSAVAENIALDKFSASTTHVSIDNLTLPVLELSNTAQGKLQDLADFAVKGPLQEILKPVFEDVSGTGETQMDLELSVALFDEPAATDDAAKVDAWKPLEVRGSVFLNNNDITFGRADLVLEDTAGAVGFNEHGVEINNLGGNLLGQAVRVSGQTRGQGPSATTTIDITGALEANDFLAHYGNPLDQFIRGASQWDVTIAAPHSEQRIKDEGVILTIASDLTGSSLLLPAPFDKGTSIAKGFTLSTAFRTDMDDQLWDVRYGEELRTRVWLVDDAFESMLIELGQTDPAGSVERTMPPPGIRLEGKVSSFAADGWVETIARYIDSVPATEGDPEPILPISAELRTGKLIIGQELFGSASLLANTDNNYLNFFIDNASLVGNLRYPREHWDKSKVLKTTIKKLDWSVIDALADASDDAVGGSSNSEPLDPRLLPRVEARVSLLTRGNIRLRDLNVRTEPNVSGLDITTVGFAHDTMRLVGQGHWYLRDPQGVNTELAGKHSTQLDLVLQSDDFGVGLEELGLGGIIADAQGTVEIQVKWPGPLYSPEIARLDGTAKIDMNSGSIIPLEPGGGRVVGLFAMQALPRRLNLDFKDLTQEGLAFTSISGTANIENGVADVPLLQLTGPIGVVDIVGTSNLNTQEFDQEVNVVPRISAALPILAAVSAGATAGIGTLVAAGLLKALGLDIDRIGLRSYSLTGKWTDPVVTPVAPDYAWRHEPVAR